MTSEALEQSRIANTQALPWIWVIEALASYKSVDTSILIQLYKNCPHISGEMGKQAREIVSLRILESFLAKDNQDIDSHSTPSTGERIQFDPSESCEDVLQQILTNAPASNIRNGGVKTSKWDVQSFIAIKRARVKSFSLQKLKAAILEGKHSALEALKERSGITTRTRSNNNIPANGGQTDESVQRPENSSKIMEAAGPSTTSNFTSTEKCDDELQENVPERNLLPAKRNRSNVSAENLERETAKKHKQTENGPRHDSVDVMITASQNDIPVKPSELVEIVETEVHRLDKDDVAVHNEFVASAIYMEAQLRRPTNPVDQDIGRNSSSQMLGQTDKIGEGHRDSEGHGLRTSNGILLASTEAPSTVDKASKFKHDYHASGPAEAKDHIEHDQEPKAINDSDEYHEAASCMNSKKNAFLSSQCTESQDSLATPLKHCMKCNEGEHLLVCSSNNCPIVVHEDCLGSTANFDCKGHFYCPFCAYSRAVSEYMEAKNRVSIAKKAFSIFIDLEVGSRQKLSERSHKSKGNQSKKNEAGQKTNVPDNHIAFSSKVDQKNSSSTLEDQSKENQPISYVPDNHIAFSSKIDQKNSNSTLEDRSKGNQPKTNVTENHIALSSKIDQKNSSSNLEDGQKTKPSVPLSDSTPCIGNPVDVAHEAPIISETDTDLGQERRSPSRHGVPLKTSDGVISSDLEIGFSDGNEKGKHNRIIECQKTGSELASPADDPCEPTERIEEEGDKSAASGHTLRSRGTSKRFNNPAIPQLRRKKLPWTSVEEEKLKEGVEKYRGDDDPMIRWRQILEFGAAVFQSGRTTIDLKDKWRNICKKNAKLI